MSNEVAVVKHKTLVEKFASKYTIEPARLLSILKATAFKQKDGEASNEQLAALLVVADQYGLNPFTREIFAFPDKQNGIVPVVGVDGWSRIINDHPQMDGIEFTLPPQNEWKELPGAKPCPEWMEVTIHRKDRAHPISVREYLDEGYRPAGRYPDGNPKKDGPWQTHTKRMLRNKVLIQGGRLAFGFAGIYEPDEAERIAEAIDVTPVAGEGERGAGARLKAALRVDTAAVIAEAETHMGETIDGDTGEILNKPLPTDREEPHPFDKTADKAPKPDAAPTLTVEQRIAAATSQADLTPILQDIMKVPAGAERNKVMQTWNAKVKSLKAPPKEELKEEPPKPKREKGTEELKAGVIAEMSKALNMEALDTVADAANVYDWPDDMRKELSEKYLAFKDELEGAGH